jgi:transposase
MEPYSMDLRRRVLADCDAGLPTQAVAAKYTVSDSWVRKLKRRRCLTGSAAPATPRRPPPGWAADADRIRAAVAAQPDLTLEELRGQLGLAYSLATLWRATQALGLTLKKKRAGPPSRTGPTSPRGGSSGGTPSRRWTRRG